MGRIVMQLYYLNGLLKQQFGFCSVPFIHCSVTHSMPTGHSVGTGLENMLGDVILHDNLLNCRLQFPSVKISHH